MNGIPQATILMCTFNAQNFIQMQLESLLNQTYQNIKIIIYDDNSTDDTLKIINGILANTERNVILRCNVQNSGGACENFIKILKDNACEKYIFFSDQDDVWEKTKVEIMMNKMMELEKKKKIPYMICHNCEVTDEELNIIDYKIIDSVNFWKLIMHPTIQGCCMMINDKAVNKLKLDDCFFYMHDWYISLVISLCGHIEVLEDSLIKYRQHSNNQIGYKKIKYMIRIKNILNMKLKVNNYVKVLKQLYSVSIIEHHLFLKSFREVYENGNKLKVIKFFWENHVIEHNIHGIYQAIILMKAMYKIYGERKKAIGI